MTARPSILWREVQWRGARIRLLLLYCVSLWGLCLDHCSQHGATVSTFQPCPVEQGGGERGNKISYIQKEIKRKTRRKVKPSRVCLVRTNDTDKPRDRGHRRPVWAESGGRIAWGSAFSPPLRCRRILSKQGMECTPVFHNLFPHSSPLHVYKQRPEEEGGKRGKEAGESHREPSKYVARAPFSRAKREGEQTGKKGKMVKWWKLGGG